MMQCIKSCANMWLTHWIIMQHTLSLMSIVLYTKPTFLQFTKLPKLIYRCSDSDFILWFFQKRIDMNLSIHDLIFRSHKNEKNNILVLYQGTVPVIGYDQLSAKLTVRVYSTQQSMIFQFSRLFRKKNSKFA